MKRQLIYASEWKAKDLLDSLIVELLTLQSIRSSCKLDSDPVLPGFTNKRGYFRAGRGNTWIDYHSSQGRLERGPLNCVFLFSKYLDRLHEDEEYIRLQIWRHVTTTINGQMSFRLVWQRRVQLSPISLSLFRPSEFSPQFVVRDLFLSQKSSKAQKYM
jgi:hypothetical protein